MSYTHTLTETIRNDPITFKTNDSSIFRLNDEKYNNKLIDRKISNQQKQRRQKQRRQGFLKHYAKKMKNRNANSEEFSNRSPISNTEINLKNSNVDEISEKISKKSRFPISDNIEESKEFSNPENFNSEMKKTLENYTLSTMMISFVTLVGMLFL